MALQEISSAEIYGIGKRVNNELEQFPLHTHSAIVEVIRVGMQHRQLAMQDADRREANERQERALRIQEKMQAGAAISGQSPPN